MGQQALSKTLKFWLPLGDEVCYTNLQQNGPYVGDNQAKGRQMTPQEALILANNLQHKVVAVSERDPQTSLLALAEQYFRTQVAGQAEGTVDAKQRDLACFLTFYMQLYGHDDRREWYKSVTEAFLKALARGQVPWLSKRGEPKPQRLSQSTIARTYATVRHFASWIHKHVAAFPLGCPTDGVKAPEEEPKWKGLSRLTAYPDDGMPEVAYGRALALFQLGRDHDATTALKEAVRWRPRVAAELLKTRHRRPLSPIPGFITVGGADEAYAYWQHNGRFWEETEGALAWVAETRHATGQRRGQKRGPGGQSVRGG
jgi:hypothetical protein